MIWAIGIVCLFGLSVGSFLNVVIYRIGLDDDSNNGALNDLGARFRVLGPMAEGLALLGGPPRQRSGRPASPSERGDGSPNFLKKMGDPPDPIWRGSPKRTFLGGHSCCPHCKIRLKWFELIPVLSFIIQKKKCNSCGKPILWQYPLVELGTSLLFVLITLQYLNGVIKFL